MKLKLHTLNIVLSIFLIAGLFGVVLGFTGTAGKIMANDLSGDYVSTFGTTSIGSQSTTLFTGIPRAIQYTPASSGIVTDILLYLSGSGRAMVAIYADTGDNAPGALLAQSSSDVISSMGWHDFSGFNVPIVGGARYWLAAEADSANILWYFENSGQRYYQGDTSNSYGVFPNPYVPWWSSTFTVSIYAIYVSSINPSPTPVASPTPTPEPFATPTPTPIPPRPIQPSNVDKYMSLAGFGTSFFAGLALIQKNPKSFRRIKW